MQAKLTQGHSTKFKQTALPCRRRKREEYAILRPVICHQISWSERGFPQFIAGEREAAHGK